MNKTTLVLLSIASMAGAAGIASATPLGVNEVAQGIGSTQSQLAQGGAGGSNVSTAAQNIGSNVFQAALNSNGTASVQTIPEPGTLLLLGIGFVAVAIWQHRLRRGWTT
jgi:PEP-CTERM motif